MKIGIPFAKIWGGGPKEVEPPLKSVNSIRELRGRDKSDFMRVAVANPAGGKRLGTVTRQGEKVAEILFEGPGEVRSPGDQVQRIVVGVDEKAIR